MSRRPSKFCQISVSDFKSSIRGFTLIELLVVMALIGLIFAVAIPQMGSYFRISLESGTRDLASTIKEGYNATIVTGLYHRVVFDLKESKYWVEYTSGEALLDTEDSLKKDEERSKRFKKTDDKEKAGGPAWAKAENISSKPKSLPSGVKFDDILTENAKEPITEGKAYTHFFPNGFTQSTLIHLSDSSDHKNTLCILPFLGKSKLLLGRLEAKEKPCE